MKKVLQNPKSGRLRVEDITPPILEDGGLLVQNTFSVVSAGTEKSIIELSRKNILQKAKERPDYVRKFLNTIKTKGLLAAWQMAQAKLSQDIALGYSSAGRVIRAGKGTRGFRVGDRVACAGQNYASHAEVIYVPQNLAVKIPETVDSQSAAFTTLGAIALQGVRQANLSAGESVAVIGLGLLGQIGARILRAYGHPVIGLDVNAKQVEFALAHGLSRGAVVGKDDLEAVVREWSGGRGVDAVIVYASSKDNGPLRLAVSLVRDKGRIVQVGSVAAEIPWRDFYAKELAFFSSRSYGPGRYDKEYEELGRDYPYSFVRWTEKRNMEEFLRLLQTGAMEVKSLVSRVFPIVEAEAAYREVFRPRGLVHGLVLEYPNQPVATEIFLPLPSATSQAAEKTPLIKIGLIGLGAFARGTILPILKKQSDVKIEAICNADGAAAKQAAEEVGAAYTTSDYHRLITDPNINLIICATRHSSHAEIAAAALSANKNVYVEKPLALDMNELKKVMAAAEKSKGRLLVGFNRKFSPHGLMAQKTFAKTKSPLLLLYRVNAGPLEASHWVHEEREGGRLLGEGCHFVHFANFITNELPQKVWAATIPSGGTVVHEESFTVNIEYENDSLATIFYSALGNFKLPKESVEIHGGGTIVTINDFQSGEVLREKESTRLNLSRQDKGHAKEIESFLEVIRNGAPTPIPLKEIFAAHTVLFAAQESLRTGVPVVIKTQK